MPLYIKRKAQEGLEALPAGVEEWIRKNERDALAEGRGERELWWDGEGRTLGRAPILWYKAIVDGRIPKRRILLEGGQALRIFEREDAADNANDASDTEADNGSVRDLILRDMDFFLQNHTYADDLAKVAHCVSGELTAKLVQYQLPHCRMLLSVGQNALLVCARMVAGGWINHAGAQFRVAPKASGGLERRAFQLERAAGHGSLLTLPWVRWQDGRLVLQGGTLEETLDLIPLLHWNRPPEGGRPIIFRNRLEERIHVPRIAFEVNNETWRTAPIFIRDTGREGLGVFAAELIPAKTLVTLYGGKMIERDKPQSDSAVGEGSHYLSLHLDGSAFAPGCKSGNILDGVIRAEEGLTLEYFVERGTVGSFLNAASRNEANCCKAVTPSHCEDPTLKYIPFDKEHELDRGLRERFFYVTLSTRKAVAPGVQLRFLYQSDHFESEVPYMDIDKAYALARPP
jgi:hypothetical protein